MSARITNGLDGRFHFGSDQPWPNDSLQGESIGSLQLQLQVSAAGSAFSAVSARQKPSCLYGDEAQRASRNHSPVQDLGVPATAHIEQDRRRDEQPRELGSRPRVYPAHLHPCHGQLTGSQAPRCGVRKQSLHRLRESNYLLITQIDISRRGSCHSPKCGQ